MSIMKMKFLKPVAAALVCAVMASCINNDDYGTPVSDCANDGISANKTVAEVIAGSNSSIQNYANEDVIEAYVVSSDERGNFFKIVYLQTLPSQGAPKAFSVGIDKNTLFGEGLYPGKKVYVKLKGLDHQISNGLLALGRKYQTNEDEPDATPTYAVGRLSEQEWANYIFPSCTEEVAENELVRAMTIDQATADANLGTLIKLTGVQFADDEVGGTYYDEDDSETAGGATNRTLTDADGNEVLFRTSSFGNFAGDVIPGNSGTVTGIITKYNGEYQFMARGRDDIQLTEDRIVDVVVPGEPSDSAKGGTAIVYSGSFTEPWSSYAVDTQVFPAYVNDNSVGTRYWELTEFSGNKYIEMTSFSGSGNPGATCSSEIFIPVNFDAAGTFSFDKEIRYNQGQALKVYYVTSVNYTPGNTYDVATFVDITNDFSNLNTNYPAIGSSQNSFSTAGTYNIPSTLTGNGYFVFQYVGGGTVTTTIQIDNVTVAP